MTWYRTVFADTPVTDRQSLVKALWCETSDFTEALASVENAPRPVKLQWLADTVSVGRWVDIDPIPVKVGTSRDGHPVYASYDPVKAQQEHIAAAHAVDRRGWTDDQWVADADLLFNHADGSVQDLNNGHVRALLDKVKELRELRSRLAGGWVPFGFHQDFPVFPPLEFSAETDDDGDPLWERRKDYQPHPGRYRNGPGWVDEVQHVREETWRKLFGDKKNDGDTH